MIIKIYRMLSCIIVIGLISTIILSCHDDSSNNASDSSLVMIPDICGLNYDDAIEALEAVGLSAGIVTEENSTTVAIDEVISQSPDADIEVVSGSTVDLTISSGPEPIDMTTWNATIELPDGVSTSLESLTMRTIFGDYPVDESGNVTLDVYSTGPQIVFVLSPSGNPVLIGMSQEIDGTLSVNTTAQYLVFMASGGYGAPLEVRSALLKVLETEDLSSLENAISNALIEDIDAFSAYNTAIATALADTIESLQDDSESGSGIKLASMLIQPIGSHSGIQVDQTASINTIRLTNMFRRPVKVYIDQVSYVPSGGGSTVTEEVAYKDFKLDGVKALGGVISAAIDIVSGKFAYSYTYSDYYRLPVGDGHEQTNYELAVLSIGSSLGALDDQPTERKREAFNTAVWFILKDFVWTLYSGIVMPVKNYGGYSAISSYDYSGWPVFVDLFNTVMALEGFEDAVWDGDITTAAILVMDAAAQNPLVQGLFCDLMYQAAYHFSRTSLVGSAHEAASETAEKAMATAQKVMNAVGVVDILLNSFDLARAASDVAKSNWCDVWEINVLKPEIVINPETVTIASTVSSGQSQTFEVTVPDASGSVGDASTFAYSWTVTQTAGTITGHTDENTFDTSSNSITYVANSISEGSDTIKVDVTEVIVSDTGTTREYVGQAEAEVTVELITPEPFAGRLFAWNYCEETPEGSYNPYVGGWRVGIEFDKITTEPIPTQYYVYAYNFDDFYHGTSVSFTGPPWPCYVGCGEDIGDQYQIGLVGGGGSWNSCDFESLEESMNWGISRLEGIIIEVTPVY